MVERFCKQVQKALKKRFFYLYFAKGSLIKLNPLMLFKAKYSLVYATHFQTNGAKILAMVLN